MWLMKSIVLSIILTIVLNVVIVSWRNRKR